MDKKVTLASLAALAQETRLDVFQVLVRAGVGGMQAGAISDVLGLPSATLSFFLERAEKLWTYRM